MPDATGDSMILRVQLTGHEARSEATSWLERSLICSDDEEVRCRNLRVRGFHREFVERVDELGESASSSQILLKVRRSAAKDAPWSLVVVMPEELRDARISAIDYLKPH